MNLNQIDGGPAFPSQPLGQDGKPGYPAEYGMMLRDWFAGQALIGLMVNRAREVVGLPKVALAQDAYQTADAMIAVRQTAVNAPPSHA